MKTRTQRGFTLVEIIVVIGVIAILAAILTPYITKYIDDSRTAKAKNETQVIGAAMSSFYKDTGRWPIYNNANTPTYYGGVYAGTVAPTTAFINGQAGWAAQGGANWNALDTHLVNNPPAHNYAAAFTGDQKWNGPYATSLPNDPWGHPYIINAAQLQPGQTGPVWVLSAGPNGVLDNASTVTTLNAVTPATQDDIGFRLR